MKDTLVGIISALTIFKPSDPNSSNANTLFWEGMAILVTRAMLFWSFVKVNTLVLTHGVPQVPSLTLRLTSAIITVSAVYFIFDRGFIMVFRNRMRNAFWKVFFVFMLSIKIVSAIYFSASHISLLLGNLATYAKSTASTLSTFLILLYLVFIVLETFIIFAEFSMERAPYQEKIQKLLFEVKNSSAELYKSFVELNQLGQDKEKSLENLEKNLRSLKKKEQDLLTKIAALEKIPVEAIKQFEIMLEKGDKRSAYRDYILFFLGALVSILGSIILKKYFEI